MQKIHCMITNDNILPQKAPHTIMVTNINTNSQKPKNMQSKSTLKNAKKYKCTKKEDKEE